MEKLLAIVTLGQNLYGRWFFRQLVSRVMMLVGLTVVAAIMTGTFLTVALYAAYLLLLYSGLPPLSAVLIVGGVCLVLSFVALATAHASLRRVQEFPRQILEEKSPSLSQAISTFDAFMEGLLSADRK